MGTQTHGHPHLPCGKANGTQARRGSLPRCIRTGERRPLSFRQESGLSKARAPHPAERVSWLSPTEEQGGWKCPTVASAEWARSPFAEHRLGQAGRLWLEGVSRSPTCGLQLPTNPCVRRYLRTSKHCKPTQPACLRGRRLLRGLWSLSPPLSSPPCLAGKRTACAVSPAGSGNGDSKLLSILRPRQGRHLDTQSWPCGLEIDRLGHGLEIQSLRV